MKVYHVEYREAGAFTQMPTYREVIAESKEDAIKKAALPPEYKVSVVDELTDDYMISMAGTVDRYMDFVTRRNRPEVPQPPDGPDKNQL